MKIIGRLDSYNVERINIVSSTHSMPRSKLDLSLVGGNDALQLLFRAHRSSYPAGFWRDPTRRQWCYQKLRRHCSRKDSCPLNIKGQKVPKPEIVGCGMLPCVGRVPIKSMDCDDTG